jgi:DNA-directed RNA polymerase specialized sigma24 family protein
MTTRRIFSTEPTRTRREVLRANFDHVAHDASLWFDTDPAASDTRDALALRVREVVAQHLTSRQREIVEWHFFEGLSQGDIARRLGVTQQVVQKALYGVTREGRPVGGALRRLRDVLTGTAAAQR